MVVSSSSVRGDGGKNVVKVIGVVVVAGGGGGGGGGGSGRIQVVVAGVSATATTIARMMVVYWLFWSASVVKASLHVKHGHMGGNTTRVTTWSLKPYSHRRSITLCEPRDVD